MGFLGWICGIFRKNRVFGGTVFSPRKAGPEMPFFGLIAGKTGLFRLSFKPDFEGPALRFGGIFGQFCGIFCKSRRFGWKIGKISGKFSSQDPLFSVYFRSEINFSDCVSGRKKREKRPFSVGFWDGFVGFSAKIAFLGVRLFFP